MQIRLRVSCISLPKMMSRSEQQGARIKLGGVGEPLHLRLLSSRNGFTDTSEPFQCVGSLGVSLLATFRWELERLRGAAHPEGFSFWEADFVGIGWLCITNWKPMVAHLAGSLLFSP